MTAMRAVAPPGGCRVRVACMIAMAVATAIAIMHATRTLHPPGGATALIAVIGSPQIHDLGFFYVLVPVTLGTLILLAVALVVNNLPKSRRYPEVWL